MPGRPPGQYRLARRGVVTGALALAVQLVLAGGLGLTQEILEGVARRYGTPAVQRLEGWQQVMRAYRDRPERDKLRAVNQFFNTVRYRGDPENWGESDYWATPVELLSVNAGDCEDFSIAKYFTLREMGVPEERLRITYVKALRPDQVHMVLAYYATPEAEPVLLDNLTDEIRPASERSDLVPVYSFNGEGLWLAVQRGQGQRVAGPERLGPWRDLALRMRKEHGDHSS
jgi:predicted transglutaminase-like cysteine proteinase